MQSREHLPFASKAVHSSKSSILDTVNSSGKQLEWRKHKRKHQVYDAEVEPDVETSSSTGTDDGEVAGKREGCSFLFRGH